MNVKPEIIEENKAVSSVTSMLEVDFFACDTKSKGNKSKKKQMGHQTKNKQTKNTSAQQRERQQHEKATY